MRVKFSWSILFIFSVLTLVNAQQINKGYFEKNKEVYFKFEVSSTEELNELTKIISIDDVRENTVFAYANERQFFEFKKLDYKIEILKRPGNKDIKRVTDDLDKLRSWDYYPTYDAYVNMMYQFHSDYPNLCEIVDAGNTVEGRKILFAKISDNVGQTESEPQFMYTSTMHGDETTGYVLMLRLIDSLLTTYGNDNRITNLVNNVEIWINPNANPDGTYNSGDNTVNGATRGNANGVDLNRNFPDPDDGPHPDGYSYQPETVSMMDIAESNNFVLSANFHGGAEVVNYPWDTWSRLHTDDNWYKYICHEYADTAHTNSPTTYMDGYNNGITNGYQWYPIYGGRQDYMTYFRRGRETTIELSDIKLVSASQLPVYWEYNKASLLNYMEQALNGITGIVTNTNGNTVKAEVIVEEHDTDMDNTSVFSDSTTGKYTRMLYGGNYDVTFKAENHFDKTVSNVTVTDGSTTELNVTLISKLGEQDSIAPSSIADLSVTDTTSSSLILQWSAPHDTSYDGVVDYEVCYSGSPITDTNDFNSANLAANSIMPGDSGETEQLVIGDLNFDTKYYFAVVSYDIWNNKSELSNIAEGRTYGAPAMSVTPTEMNDTLSPGVSVQDTLKIKNTSEHQSTLDYQVELVNKSMDFITLSNSVLETNKTDYSKSKNNDNSKGASLRGFGGPDSFGYEWIDSEEDNGPEYQWNDISSSGTVVSNWTATGSFGAKDEGYGEPINIGFDFDFYGNPKQEVYVGSNGFITFSPFSENSYSNDAIPDSDNPNDIIAALWDDLDGSNGNVYYKNENDRLIIQYDNWGEYSDDGTFDFQIVLNANGKIEIFYKSMTGDLTSVTVGIENADGTDGLQVTKDAPYIEDQLALQFSSEPEWIAMEGQAGILYSNNAVNMEIDISTEGLELNQEYTNEIKILSNAPGSNEITVPVSVIVSETGLLTVEIGVNSGWNLVSLPVNTSDNSISEIFPDAASDAFGFNGIYFTPEEMHTGEGYWLKFDNSRTVELAGSKVESNIQLDEGWNIFGVYDEAVNTNAISTQPAGILSSQFFAYNNGYNTPSELASGKAYWIKASQAGEITLNSNIGNKKLPKVNNEWTELIFEDAEGSKSKLYLTKENSNLNNFELPPMPPSEVTDVRFTNGKFAAHKRGEGSINSANYPIKMSVIGDDVQVNLNNDAKGSVLKSNESMTINTNIKSLSIGLSSIPTQYSLFQNYPNPFNPSTTIKFAIPEKSNVELAIFNVLGEKVRTLIDKQMDAGNHRIKFNSESLSSGIYFYTLRANDFKNTKKMILLR